jgi:CO/xanthine dehydrogenase Mo-binding subunit
MEKRAAPFLVFGARLALALWASRKLKRPVKWIAERSERPRSH